MYDTGVQAYNKVKLNVESKEKLLIMAYDHAIKFLKQSKREQMQKKFYESFQLVLKAKKIIRELQNSLNMEIEEISMPLFRLYDYMNLRLNQINVGLGVMQPVDEVVELLDGLRQAWIEGIKKEMESKGGNAGLKNYENSKTKKLAKDFSV